METCFYGRSLVFSFRSRLAHWLVPGGTYFASGPEPNFASEHNIRWNETISLQAFKLGAIDSLCFEKCVTCSGRFHMLMMTRRHGEDGRNRPQVGNFILIRSHRSQQWHSAGIFRPQRGLPLFIFGPFHARSRKKITRWLRRRILDSLSIGWYL